MNEWLNIGIHQVNAILSKDDDFNDLLRQLELAQASYNDTVSSLSKSHREQIENYIALCEEIAYQKALTAYYCGKRNG